MKTNKQYHLFLDDQKIGTSELEKADAPMGVVFGHIKFLEIESGYDFFKSYCSKNKIEFTDQVDDRLILTRHIPNLKVFNNDGNEISGMTCSISGMDSDSYEIIIEGVPYPFYEEEFPQHVEAYKNQFNDLKKYKYHFRPCFGSENLLIEVYTGVLDKNFNINLFDAIKEISPKQISSEDLWMNDEMIYEFNSSVGNFSLSKSTWGAVCFMSDDQKCIHVINSLLVKDSRFEKVEVDFDKYVSQPSTNYNSIKARSFLRKLIQFFKNSSRNKDPFHIKNLSKVDYWKKWEFFELMEDLHLASEMLSEREGGYSGKFLSAKEFKDALDDKIDDIEFGNQVDLSFFWFWFAPTCEWDDFSGLDGAELGNRIFERVDKWKKGTIDNV